MKPDEFSIDFVIYLLQRVPISFIMMAYEDYIKENQITNADINRLELQLKTNIFDKIIDLDR